MNTDSSEEHKPKPLMDLLISIIIPSVILMKFSGEEQLGVKGGLIIALAFPVCWGLYELIGHRKKNYIALLGVISVLLTGGIGLLKIDAQWLAVKEAAVPAVIGLGVFIAHKLGYPVVRKVLFNPAVFDVDRIDQQLVARGNKAHFEKRLDNANYLLAGTFVFSSVMNYLLAKWIVTGESGTALFNEQLGRMTLLSYPVIAIPSMIMMMGILFFLWRTVTKLTELKFEDIMILEEEKKAEAKKTD